MTKYFIVLALSIFVFSACDSSPKQSVPQAARQSAIQLAKQEKAAHDKLLFRGQRYGLLCGTFTDDKTFLAFVERVEKSPILWNALSEARENRVTIFVESKFSIRPGYLTIDASATDDEIIKFLMGEPASATKSLYTPRKICFDTKPIGSCITN